jgi:glycosyltransferase involved in cell wall biosynthesis
MKLSILIPAIPDRDRHPLFRFNLAPEMGVEILSLCDNKQRTVGAKRQALLDVAQGEYVCFVDDDDRVTMKYLGAILAEIEQKPDLITFKTDCRHFGHRTIIESSVGFEDEEFNPDGVTRRKPNHVHVWKRSIAVQGTFPDTSWEEGEIWARQIHHLVKFQRMIDEVLYIYLCGEWSATQ